MYKEIPSRNANFLIHQSIPEDIPPASSQGGAGEPTKQNHQKPHTNKKLKHQHTTLAISDQSKSGIGFFFSSVFPETL